VHRSPARAVNTQTTANKEPTMKRLLLSLALAAASLPSLATDIGVSIGISQPGVYGRIDIGRVGVQPVLVYPQPVVISAPSVHVVQQPLYMWVPPGHAKNWRKHCGAYNACGRQVYFVQDGWYQQHYAHAGKGHGHGKGNGKDRD
jgi:hypothetical protein